MKVQQPDGIPIMDYAQYRKACRLVHECCNYDQGNCLLLDRGDGCVCAQRISYSLLCRWFQTAVLPSDHELYAVLLCKPGTKRCSCAVGILFRDPTGRNTVRLVLHE